MVPLRLVFFVIAVFLIAFIAISVLCLMHFYAANKATEFLLRQTERVYPEIFADLQSGVANSNFGIDPYVAVNSKRLMTFIGDERLNHDGELRAAKYRVLAAHKNQRKSMRIWFAIWAASLVTVFLTAALCGLHVITLQSTF